MADTSNMLPVAHLLDRAIRLFEGDVAAARQWLQTPLLALGGRIPLQVAATGAGAREVERLITRLEHGVIT